MEEKNINYTFEGKEFRVCNEAYGIIAKRNKFLKNSNATIHSYLYYCLSMIIKIILMYYFIVICLVITEESGMVKSIDEFGIGFTTFVFMLLVCVTLFFMWNYIKMFIMISKIKRKGELEIIINNDGIRDTLSNGIGVIVKWKSIKVMIEGKYAIVILTEDKKIPLIFPINEEIINTLKRYREIERENGIYKV